jgi:hypothetical protein
MCWSYNSVDDSFTAKFGLQILERDPFPGSRFKVVVEFVMEI